MTRTITPAPRRSVPRKEHSGFTLPPGALAVVDSLVGTFIGATRSEVMRFMIVSWIVEHHVCVNEIGAPPAPSPQQQSDAD